MERIRQMWLVLTGRAQALEMSGETFARLHSEAARYRMKPGDLMEAALDVHSPKDTPSILEVESEVRDLVVLRAEQWRMDVDDFLRDSVALYDEQMGPYREMMHTESDLGDAVREAMKDIEI